MARFVKPPKATCHAQFFILPYANGNLQNQRDFLTIRHSPVRIEISEIKATRFSDIFRVVFFCAKKTPIIYKCTHTYTPPYARCTHAYTHEVRYTIRYRTHIYTHNAHAHIHILHVCLYANVRRFIQKIAQPLIQKKLHGLIYIKCTLIYTPEIVFFIYSPGQQHDPLVFTILYFLSVFLLKCNHVVKLYKIACIAF